MKKQGSKIDEAATSRVKLNIPTEGNVLLEKVLNK